MSHEIENAVYSAAEGAGWTGLGQVIPAEAANDPKRIAALVGATYSVVKTPVSYEWQGKRQDADNRVALIRDDTGDLLEVVSANRYHVDHRQPVDVFEAFRDELAKNSLVISHAAVLSGGRKIAVCAKLDRSLDIEMDSKDVTCSYVTLSTGYDGMHGSNGFLTGIRTVCANTLQYGLSDAEKAGRLIHYTAAQRLGELALKDLLANAMQVVEKEALFYQHTAAVRLTDAMAREYFAELLEINLTHLDADTKNADGRRVISTRSRNQLDALLSAWKNAPGSGYYFANGTLYGALNAVTYITDHEAQIRDVSQDGVKVARMTSATFGNGAAVKARAARLAAKTLEYVGSSMAA